MRNLIFSTIFAVAFILMFTQYSEAVCTQNGNTPEGGNIVDCGPPIQNGPLNTGSNPATTGLADEINVLSGGGINTNIGDGIESAGGDDIINIRGDVISTDRDAISSGTGDDNVIINGGNIEGLSNAVQLGAQNDTLTINGGTFKSIENPVINSGSGPDFVTLNGGFYMGEIDITIRLGGGGDTLKISGDIDLGGIISCDGGFDTLIFAMDVPEEAVTFISSQIASKNPSGDSVEINGLNYEWTDCERLVAELNSIPTVPRPIPTLSEWGMIAMAGVIGIAGLIAVRRRIAA